MPTTLQDLKPTQIKSHKSNPRRDVGDVTELAASIKEKGVIEPLVVAPNGTGDTFVLIAGERRLAASRLAKLKTVPCIVREELTDEKDQIEHMLVENLQRTNLSPIEEADAYQMLLEFPGYTQKRIVETTGRSITTVRSRLKLAKLPKAARDQVHSGQLALVDADLIVAFADDAAKFKRLTEAIGRGSLSYELGRIRSEQALERKRAKVTAELTEAGVRVLKKSPYGFGAHVLRLFGEQDIDGHRECEGFCALVDPYNAGIAYYCDQATLHDEAPVDPPVDQTPATPVVDDAANVKLALEHAVIGRHEHLAAIFTDPTESMALAALRAYAHVFVVEDCAAWVLRDILHIDAEIIAHDPDQLVEQVRALIDTLTVHQLAILLDLAHVGGDLDDSLTFPSGWRSDRTESWRHRLGGPYGYEWSEVEAELIDESEVAAADEPQS